jgi:hypothetical protein
LKLETKNLELGTKPQIYPTSIPLPQQQYLSYQKNTETYLLPLQDIAFSTLRMKKIKEGVLNEDLANI